MKRIKRICSIDGCDRKAGPTGICEMHKLRFKRHGSYDSLVGGKTCSICGDKHYGKGFCRKHYRVYFYKKSKAYFKGFSLGTNFSRGICQSENCDRGIYAKGYCKRHYAQIIRKGTITKFYICSKCGKKTRNSTTLCLKHTPKIKKYEHIYGYTLSHIGKVLGLSRQRIYQLHQRKELRERMINECKQRNINL